MTRPDPRHEDWSDLAEVWTAPQAGPPPAADLAARMRRRAFWARVNFHFEAWGAVVAGLVGGGFAFGRHAPVMGGAAVAFALFALAATLWARRGAEPGLAATPREALQAAIRQARSGLRWARAGQAVSAAALLFTAVVAVDAGAWPGGWFYAAVLAFLAACVAFYERHARRARARMADHQAALDELERLD